MTTDTMMMTVSVSAPFTFWPLLIDSCWKMSAAQFLQLSKKKGKKSCFLFFGVGDFSSSSSLSALRLLPGVGVYDDGDAYLISDHD